MPSSTEDKSIPNTHTQPSSCLPHTHTHRQTDFILTYKVSVSIMVHSTYSCRKKAFQYFSAWMAPSQKQEQWNLLRASVIVNKVLCTNLHLKSFSRKWGAAHFARQSIHLQEKQILLWNDLSILLVTFYYLNYTDNLIFLFLKVLFF